MTARAPSLLSFQIALYAAPLMFGAIVWLLTLAGEYAARFAMVGGYGLLVSLPLWLTVFAWLAWRALKRGETAPRSYLLASLGANLGTMILYPAAVFILAATGHDLSLKGGADGGVPPDTLGAAMLAGGASFFLGLFFLPILAALFVWIGRRVKLFQ